MINKIKVILSLSLFGLAGSALARTYAIYNYSPNTESFHVKGKYQDDPCWDSQTKFDKDIVIQPQQAYQLNHLLSEYRVIYENLSIDFDIDVESYVALYGNCVVSKNSVKSIALPEASQLSPYHIIMAKDTDGGDIYVFPEYTGFTPSPSGSYLSVCDKVHFAISDTQRGIGTLYARCAGNDLSLAQVNINDFIAYDADTHTLSDHAFLPHTLLPQGNYQETSQDIHYDVAVKLLKATTINHSGQFVASSVQNVDHNSIVTNIDGTLTDVSQVPLGKYLGQVKFVSFNLEQHSLYTQCPSDGSAYQNHLSGYNLGDYHNDLSCLHGNIYSPTLMPKGIYLTQVWGASYVYNWQTGDGTLYASDGDLTYELYPFPAGYTYHLEHVYPHDLVKLNDSGTALVKYTDTTPPVPKIPEGDYQKQCSNIQFSNNILTASCQAGSYYGRVKSVISGYSIEQYQGINVQGAQASGTNVLGSLTATGLVPYVSIEGQYASNVACFGSQYDVKAKTFALYCMNQPYQFGDYSLYQLTGINPSDRLCYSTSLGASKGRFTVCTGQKSRIKIPKTMG